MLSTDCDEWVLTWDEQYPEESRQLQNDVRKFLKVVTEEQRGLDIDHYLLREIATVTYCSDKKFPFQRVVHSPDGTLLGVVFPEVCAVKWEAYTKQLEASPTFLEQFHKAIQFVDKKYSPNLKHSDNMLAENAATCRRKSQRLHGKKD